MKPQAPSTMPLFERAKYFPESLDRETVADAMAELAAFVELGSTPEDLAQELESLRDVEEKPSDYDDLKSFFDDIVDSWENTLANGRWPCPEAYDQNLRSAIIDDMQAGADAISAIEQFLATDDRDALVEFFNGLKGC